MKNITHQLNDSYFPYKAILIYQRHEDDGKDIPRFGSPVYVESYDIGKNGNPINAHPLTIKEMSGLATLLQSSQELRTGYCIAEGILPAKVLHINTQGTGCVIWYTPPQEVSLFFAAALDMPSGKAHVPALVWKADKERLAVFALKGSQKPQLHTPLFHAPFFNIYEGGDVCMGTVAVDIKQSECLEDFITKWESYFWNSYFSHLIDNFTPVDGDIVLLWKQLVKTNEKFPVQVLKPTSTTIQDLLP